MPRVRRVVTLTKAERGALEQFVARGKKSARAITRARILLLSDEGKKECELTALLGVSRGTVYNVRKKDHQQALLMFWSYYRTVPAVGGPSSSTRAWKSRRR